MTDETLPTSPKRNPFMEEAALWFARMRGPEAEAHREHFEAWLARGALHRSAYNRAGEIFSIGKFLEGEPPTLHPTSENASGSVGEPAHQAADRPRGLPLLVLFAIITIIISIGWGWILRSDVRRVEPDHAIANSEKQKSSFRLSTDAAAMTRRLSDGSTVILQPRTDLLVAFDDGERRLSLERGTASFDVAHERRSFRVSAGGGTVTAKGTLFEVDLADDCAVTVRLIRGRVDVAMPRTGKTTASVSHLEPGQSVSFSGTSSPQPASKTAPTLMSPVAELQEFDGIRLGDLVARANAINGARIVLADPRAADRAVSGRFTINNPKKLANQLAWIFGGHVSSKPNDDLVLSGV